MEDYNLNALYTGKVALSGYPRNSIFMDMEKAAELLRERGLSKAAKKSGRIAAEGLAAAYVSEDGKVNQNSSLPQSIVNHINEEIENCRKYGYGHAFFTANDRKNRTPYTLLYAVKAHIFNA